MLQRRNFYWIFYAALILAAYVGFNRFGLEEDLDKFEANIFSEEKNPEFNGTTMPIHRVPNWMDLSQEKWRLNYEEIPQDQFIPIPKYDPDLLKIPLGNLKADQEPDRSILNAKIIYGVPYMGNYQFDGLEYTGSHLAVDIKTLNNTPVYAIGDGIVTKVSLGNTGFGNHIVIKHENFPSIEDAMIKTTYFSSYSHLGTVLVTEGKRVSKGDKIGLTGQSGNASLPHLHFQMDTDISPWHPYWPFTYKDAADAGYTYHEAINAGLGKEKALKATINPMTYVQLYLDQPGMLGNILLPSQSNIAQKFEQLRGSAPAFERVSPAKSSKKKLLRPLTQRFRTYQSLEK